MSRIAPILTILGVLSGLLAAAAPSRAEPPDASRSPSHSVAREGILLLKNGQVLAGRITWSGDHYFVDRSGLQMGVRAAEVASTATDMDDAYRQQHARIAPSDLDGHQTLAQWCLRHGLLGYTATELAECETIHPGNPRTALLMRQLQSAIRVADAASQAPTSSDLTRSDAEKHEAPQSTRTEERTPESPANGESAKSEAPALSNHALETFVTTIQPLLINQCAGGGCHGGATSAHLKLQRFDPRRSPSRIYTERNLAAVLKYVDRDKPDQSPLLLAPSQPHGSAKSAIFAGRTAGYQAELAAWVHSTVRAPGNVSRGQGRAESAAAAETNRGKSPVVRAGHDAISPSGRRDVRDHSSAPSEATDATSPANPHDPDEFNQRFFPNGRPTSEPEMTPPNDRERMPSEIVPFQTGEISGP